MQRDYYRSEITDVINSGPAGGPDYKFQVRVFGEQVSKHLRASADQLRCLADVLDETNPPSLLPLQNGHRVLHADVRFDSAGMGLGHVIADVSGESAHEFVVWTVYLHKGESRWLAENGDYCSTMAEAVDRFNARRGVSQENGPAVYFVAWVGGYDQPSHFATFNEHEARARFAEWKAQAKNDEGDADWVTLLKFNPATGTLTEVDAQ